MLNQKHTQRSKIIGLLATGRRYSKLDLIHKGCGTKPDTRISEARAQGHPILDEWHKYRGARFKRYYLDPKALKRQH